MEPGKINTGANGTSEGEIEALVRAFESCTLPPSEFTHQAHLTVAFWYLKRLPAAEAQGRMRDGLRRFLRHHRKGADAYNETITLFWLRMVRGFIESRSGDFVAAELAAQLAERFGDPRLVFEYYSRERVTSARARVEWLEPDLRPFDL